MPYSTPIASDTIPGRIRRPVAGRYFGDTARASIALDAATAEWSTARRKLLAAQSGLSRAEQKFDRASKALERFDNPDLFEQRRR